MAAAPWQRMRCPPTIVATVRRKPSNLISAGQRLLAMPFDAMRVQYASVVMAGLAPRSLLCAAKTERAIDALEKLTLGPLARQR